MKHGKHPYLVPFWGSTCPLKFKLKLIKALWFTCIDCSDDNEIHDHSCYEYNFKICVYDYEAIKEFDPFMYAEI